jgi:hypothetical protein
VTSDSIGGAESLRAAREATLVDNTAQGIFKHLDRLEEHRKKFEARWVWELLQNARDAAGAQGVSIEIVLEPDRLEFRHDGRPFAAAEIAHLIYHGSTKVDDVEDLDHFGSGFLSTHLLSRVVRVRGQLDDGRGFEFDLDRTGRTTDELREATNRSWDDFERSCADLAIEQDDGRTVYSYRLAPALSGFAREGLTSLRSIGPLVLAFSPEIRKISITARGEEWSVVRRGREQLTDSIEMIRVACYGAGVEELQHLAVAGGHGDVQVVLPLVERADGLTAALDPTTPRLFVLFPLLTTERFPLPVVVNSKHFKPQEDRDGVVLDGTSERTAENKDLLDLASRLTLELLGCGAESRWLGLETLVSYDSSDVPDWVDREWLRAYFRSLVASTRELPLVVTPEGSWISPTASWIPFDQVAHRRETLWDLTAAWVDGRSCLPTRASMHVWFDNLRSWQQLEPTEELVEAFSLSRLAELVDDAATVEELGATLVAPTDVFQWLGSLLELVTSADEFSLLDHRRLLASQIGVLRRRSDLCSDDGIPEQLKVVAESLDVQLRDELLDGRASTQEIVALLPNKSEEDALDDVIDGLQARREDDWLSLELVPANRSLFWWIALSKDHSHRLDGYPLATADENESHARVIELKRDHERAPLAPPSIWPDSARTFSALFPPRKIIHPSVAEADEGTPDAWKLLARNGFVRLGPLFDAHRRFERLLIPDLDDSDEGQAHEGEEDLLATDIAFISDDQIGLMDTVRKSRPRAVQLVEFLTTSVIADDSDPFRKITVSCACGEEHAAFAAAWLKPLRDRSWIPQPGGRSVRVSAESLAGLVGDQVTLVEQLVDTKGTELLEALGISQADFQLRAVASEEHERVALVRSIGELARAAGGSVHRVEMLVREIRDHPEIIDAIEKGKEERAKVRLNQELGKLVEDLLQEELTAQGLIVRRTGVGSDFEAESDLTDGGEEVLLEIGGEKRSILIEVKSARSDRVRMTPTQARTAHAEQTRFALCVVPLPDDSPTREVVREASRFVFDIGRLLEAPLKDYMSLLSATEDARRQRGAIDVEVAEGQIRFAVSEPVWVGGIPLSMAAEEIRSRLRQAG